MPGISYGQRGLAGCVSAWAGIDAGYGKGKEPAFLWRRHVNALEKLSRLVIGENRVLPFLTTCSGPAYRRCGIDLDDLAHDEPIEQHANRCEVLLDRGCAVAPAEELDIDGD